MGRFRLVITAAALPLAGCAAGVPGLRPLTYQQPADTRVLVSYNRCPNTTPAGQNLAPAIAAVVTAAASKLLDNFGQALSKGAEGGNLPASVASTNVEIGADEMPACLIILRGTFGEAADAKSQVSFPMPQTYVAGRPYTPFRIKQPDKTFIDIGPPKMTELQHYAELQLYSSDDDSALTFAPVVTWVNRSMDGGRQGKRGLSIAVKFERPGKQATGGAVLINNHTVSASPRRYQVVESGRLEYEAPWFSGIHAAAPPKAAAGGGSDQQQSGTGGGSGQATESGGGTAQAQGAGGEAQQTASTTGADPLNAGRKGGPFPFTISTTVVESRPTKQFLAFVASVFTAAKPAFDTEIKNRVDPATIDTRAGAELEAEGSFAEAFGKARAAILDYCAMDEAGTTRSARFTKSGEVRKAQVTANKAAIPADRDEPFRELISISGDPPQTANATACELYK